MPGQVTMVSLYGEKDEQVSAAIRRWQQAVAHTVGDAFTPYHLSQTHATIIGLERHQAPAYNANFAKYRGRNVAMDFAGFLDYLRRCGRIPFEVQLGGFVDRDYPFTSRGTTPYRRSFSVQGDTVVVMGWPVCGKPLPASGPLTPADRIHEARIYPPTLDLIRREAQDFGVLHAYHRQLEDVDNDFFFRIGLIDPTLTTPEVTSALEDEVRRLLSHQDPLVLRIGLENSYVAVYEDNTLPEASTRVWSISDPGVTGDFVFGLFT